MAETLHEIIERNVIIAFIVHGSINAVGCVNEDGVFIVTHDDDGQEEPPRAKAFDANDVHRKLGTEAARALTDRLPDVDFKDKPKARGNGRDEPSIPPNPIKILTYDEMVNLPPPDWLIEGVVPHRAKSVLFGPSNSFKTFIAVDIGGSSSTGMTYHGKPTKKCKVFYVANEGANAVGRKRIAAWMAYHNVPAEDRRNIFLIAVETILPNSILRNNLIAAIRKLVERGEDFLLIIDVLRGTMNGSESDDEAAHAWTSAAEILIAEGATILTLTHSPYCEDGRMRGHSHLWGSFDTRLQAEGDKDKKTTIVKVERHKDHDSTGQWGFQLEEQETDEHPGEFSLVPRLDGAVSSKKRGPAPKQKSLLLEVIAQAIDEAGVSIMPFADGSPIKAVSDRIVRERYNLRMGEVEPKDENGKTRLRMAFYRPLKAMIESKQVMAHPIDGDRFLWLP